MGTRGSRLPPGRASLRAHDLHQGLQAASIDRSRGLVGDELGATQKIGMAAALATGIKGLDIIADGPELRRIAESQFDIPSLLFSDVVRVLEEAEFVRNVERDGAGRIKSLWETVPEDFDRLYETCDEVYEQMAPGELEQALVRVVDHLSNGPDLLANLGLDDDLQGKLLELGDAAEALRLAGSREIAYSPFFSYENPEKVADVLGQMDVERIRAAVERIRASQGLPILAGDEGEVLNALVAAGLVAAPGLLNPGNVLQTFAVAPYGLSVDLLTTRKAVLHKAEAVLAAVRMGQHFGGVTNITHPRLILSRLLDGDWMARHSSTPRQYGVLRDMGIVQIEADRYGRAAMRLIPTDDNKLAVRTASDLLAFGEAVTTKEPSIRRADEGTGPYRTPIQTVAPARKGKRFDAAFIGKLWDIAMGHRPLV